MQRRHVLPRPRLRDFHPRAVVPGAYGACAAAPRGQKLYFLTPRVRVPRNRGLVFHVAGFRAHQPFRLRKGYLEPLRNRAGYGGVGLAAHECGRYLLVQHLGKLPRVRPYPLGIAGPAPAHIQRPSYAAHVGRCKAYACCQLFRPSGALTGRAAPLRVHFPTQPAFQLFRLLLCGLSQRFRARHAVAIGAAILVEWRAQIALRFLTAKPHAPGIPPDDLFHLLVQIRFRLPVGAPYALQPRGRHILRRVHVRFGPLAPVVRKRFHFHVSTLKGGRSLRPPHVWYARRAIQTRRALRIPFLASAPLRSKGPLRNLNRRPPPYRSAFSFRLISSGSLWASPNSPQGHRFPPSTLWPGRFSIGLAV